MMRTGWEHETMLVSTKEYEYAPNQYVNITTDTATITIHRQSSGNTAPTVTLYRVQHVYDGFAELVPLHAQRLFDEASWFPGKWEINRKAAIEGGRAQQERHQRVPKIALAARTSFQQMPRLPCYRGTRPR